MNSDFGIPAIPTIPYINKNKKTLISYLYICIRANLQKRYARYARCGNALIWLYYFLPYLMLEACHLPYLKSTLSKSCSKSTALDITTALTLRLRKSFSMLTKLLVTGRTAIMSGGFCRYWSRGVSSTHFQKSLSMEVVFSVLNLQRIIATEGL